jgi:hypothetical protein
MEKSEILLKVGSFAFIFGIIIALIIGIYQAYTIESTETTEFFITENGARVAWVLAILGLIVGVIAAAGRGTITKKETPGFLLAGIGLVIMGGIFTTMIEKYTLKPLIGSLLSGISMSLSIFVAPIVGILAIKAIWDMGKDV